MNPLRQQLCSFLDTPIDSILSAHSFEKVFAEIESILETEPPDKVINVLRFIRDARSYLASARIWEILGTLLKSPDFRVRMNTIYTIGKITDPSRAYLLSDAFPYYLEKDPINLPRLLFELHWLTHKWNWDFVQQIASAEHYLKRWCICEIPGHNDMEEEAQERFLEVFARLKSDTNSLVAAEAHFYFEQIKLELGPKLPKAEWRKELKRIESLEPKILFEFTAISFVQNRSNYTLEEFDQFVRTNFEKG